MQPSVVMVLIGIMRVADLQAQAGSIEGRVTDARSGAAVRRARVAAIRGSNDTAAIAQTTNGGDYRLDNLASGRYHVRVTSQGFLPGLSPEVLVTAGAAAVADVELTRDRADVPPLVAPSGDAALEAWNAPNVVIDAREIFERPSLTVADQLIGIPGVDVHRSGLLGAHVTTRGFNEISGGGMLFLQDLRPTPLPSLQANLPSLLTTTTEDIDRLEVRYGPTASFGPTAANGVLHLVTKSPFSSIGTTVTADGSVERAVRAAFRHARLLSPRAAFKVSGEYLWGREYHYRDPAEPLAFSDLAPPDRAGRRNQRDFDVDRVAGEARLDLRPTDASDLVTTIGVARLGTGLQPLASEGAVQVRDWTYRSLQHRARFGRFVAQAFANFSDTGGDTTTTLDGSYLLRSGQPYVDHSRELGLRVQHGLGWRGRLDVGYGADALRIDPRTARTLHGRNESHDRIDELGAYAHATARLSRAVDVDAGLRLDYNNRIEGLLASPRAGVVFRPASAGRLRLTFDRGFLLPPAYVWFSDVQRPQFGDSPYEQPTLGNRPRSGWRFNRTCPEETTASLCMMTPGPTWTPAIAANYYARVVDSLRIPLRNGLVSEFRQQGFSDQRASALAVAIVDAMAELNPTAQQVKTMLRFPGRAAGLAPDELRDLAPVGASRSTTWELGYEKHFRDRLRVSLEVWREKRDDVVALVSAAIPAAYLDKASLAEFLRAPLQKVFEDFDFEPSQASAEAIAIAVGEANRLSRAPIGLVQLSSSTFATANGQYLTYVNSDTTVTVNGVNVTLEYAVNASVTVSGAYRGMSDVLFPEATGPHGLPVALNAADHKASLAVRYRNVARGWGADVRGRYSNGYPYNSGVYATSIALALPLAGAGRYSYDPIASARALDVALHWNARGDGAAGTAFSLYVENALNSSSRSLPGAPRIGRQGTMRLRFAF